MDLNPYGGINFFFGVNAHLDVYDIEKTKRFYGNRIPKNILPIADNGMGDHVCLDLRGGKERVLFWDNRHFWSTGEWREQDLYPVADSFEAFLALLQPRRY
jgi:hypothetical protein